MEKGHIGEYTGNNAKLMKSPEIKYAGDIADETAQAHEGSPAYRKASPLNQGQMSMKSVMRSKTDPLHGGDFSDNYSFGDAFAEARSNVGHGGGHFTWQGKKYTTKRADDRPSKDLAEVKKDPISRHSSADYDKDMAEERITIEHAKEDIWEDDKKKWENRS